MLESDLASTPDQVVESEQPLSKNAQKRLAKAARRADQKLERRAKEKALKKEKKRARAIEAEDDPLPRPKKQRIAPQPFDAQIVIDLGFDKLMTPKVSPQILVRWNVVGSIRTSCYSRNAPLCVPSWDIPTPRNVDRPLHSHHSSSLPLEGKPKLIWRLLDKARILDGNTFNGGKKTMERFGPYHQDQIRTTKVPNPKWFT